MEKTFIYGLTLEGDDLIRYVGKSDNPKLRFKKHITNTKLKVKHNKKLTHKDYWLIKHEYKVSYIILEECDYNIWQDRERFHMCNYNNLTNTSNGGLGGAGIIYTLTYDETKNWVQKNLDVKSKMAWVEYIKNNQLPDSITPYPSSVYKNRGWVSWGDFLGTNRKWDNDVNYLDYESAKKRLKPMNIKNSLRYYHMVKDVKILNLPLKPNRYYKNRGWVSWGDFLSNGLVSNQFREFYSYDEFKIKIKELGLKTFSLFKKYFKVTKHRDMKIPTNPNITYKNKGWIGWNDVIF